MNRSISEPIVYADAGMIGTDATMREMEQKVSVDLCEEFFHLLP